MPPNIIDALREFSVSNNFRTPGSVSVALAMTEMALRQGLPLDSSEHLTASGTQIRGLTARFVQEILARHGISDVLAAEGGRTSRGSVSNMRNYVAFLNDLHLQAPLNLSEVEAFWVQQAIDIIRARERDDRTSFSAVPVEQNGQTFYFLTIPVSQLFPYCFVASRREEPLAGFQRALNRNRAEDIASYLNDGKGSIPTNIVLSAQPEAQVAYSNRSKILSYNLKPKSFLVLDGQHRLWGYEICREKYTKDLRIPVSIYTNLTRAEEARLFIDINTTQVGVPSALLLDIKQIAELESTSVQVLRGLFDNLNNDPESPLAKQLSPARSVAGKLSRVTFNKAVAPLIRTNVWMNTSQSSRYRVLLNFFRAIDSVVQDRALLVRASFFEAICDIFEEVVQTSIAKHSDVKSKSIQEVLSPLRHLDLNGLSNHTRPTKLTYLQPMKDALKKSIAISDLMV